MILKAGMTRPGAAFVGLVTVALAACSHTEEETGQVGAMWRNLEIEVVGTLVNVNECGILVDSEGRRYGLVGDVSRFQRGDRLRVSGPVAYWSGCGTYSAIRAEHVDRDR